MSELWRKIFGIQDLAVPEGARTRLELANLPGAGWSLAGIAILGLLILAVFTVYRREGDVAAWKKAALAAIRSLVVIVAACVLLEPSLVFDVERTLEATTIVLVDDSQSMSIRDRYGGEALEAVKTLTRRETLGDGISRSSLATAILTHPEVKLLSRLAERNRVRIYSFSDEVTPIGIRPEEDDDGATDGSPDEGAPPQLPDQGDVAPPRGDVTNLSAAVRRVLQDLGGKTGAALLILSDGRVNEGEKISVITKTLRNRGIPAHTVGLGDPTPPRNIRVDTLLANDRVFARDPVQFEVRISVQGEGWGTVTGELLQSQEGEEGVTVVDTVEIEIQGGEQTLTLRAVPEKPGRFLYTFRIPPMDDELIPEDNSRVIPITVVDDLIRVLLVSGTPSFEYRFLKNLLLRDPTVRLSVWLQSADVDFLQEGNARIHRLPATQEEFRGYDVLILIDPEPLELDTSWVEHLRQFVSDHGGGLHYVAGDKNTLHLFRSPIATGMVPLLPVEPDLVAAERSGGFGRTWGEAWPIQITPAGLDHSIGMLAKDRKESEAIWRSLPGIYWHFPIEAVKPGATALARHSDPRERGRDDLRPLIASHFFGAGRVIFSATDELWRWRSVAEDAYNRFWMQGIRFLVGGRLLGGKRRVNILIDKETYALGKPIEVTAKILDANYAPVEQSEVKGRLRSQDGAEDLFTMTPVEGKRGLYRGVLIPSAAGAYQIRIGEEFGAAGTANVTVELPKLEFQDARMDDALLRELADSTGGAFYDLSEIGKIPDAIPDRRETVVVSSSPAPLWDSPAVLALLAGLLIVEWFFRKRCRLV